MARAAPTTVLSRIRALFSGNAQQQHIEQGATAVQITGENNVVILAGEAKLHAEFRHRRAAAPRDLRDLLQPELRAIDRVGRQ
jgi:acetylornithine deacetylase/succinyl-diaminopimelate desuccinylase-like protein